MKNTLSTTLVVMIFLSFFIILKDNYTANERKLQFSIEQSGFSFPHYAHSYKIDSVGCVHFYDDIDSTDVIICGSYSIKPFIK